MYFRISEFRRSFYRKHKIQNHKLQYLLRKEKIDYINTKKFCKNRNSKENGILGEIMQYI